MKTLRNLALDQLAEMYQAEQDLAKALSRMAKLARDHELREALREHAYETMGHISKVARVFDCFGERTTGMKGQAISGLLAEANALISQHAESPASDAAIISAVQRLEHYEIAIYGCLRDWAMVLNNQEAALILEQILDEEKSGDHTLTGLARKTNVEALGEVDWRGGMGNQHEETPAHYEEGRRRRYCAAA